MTIKTLNDAERLRNSAVLRAQPLTIDNGFARQQAENAARLRELSGIKISNTGKR